MNPSITKFPPFLEYSNTLAYNFFFQYSFHCFSITFPKIQWFFFNKSLIFLEKWGRLQFNFRKQLVNQLRQDLRIRKMNYFVIKPGRALPLSSSLRG